MSDGIEIRLLGELEVRRAGRLSALPASKKTRALLAYLAATGAAHSRARLCGMFWEGPVDPRAELRWSLSKLRALLDTPTQTVVHADHEHVRIDLPQGALDLARFDALVGGDPSAAPAEALQAAATLARGELLEGLDLPDCHRFHHWLAAERERWRARRVAVLAALASQPGAAAERIRHARAWLTLEPLDERAHAALIALLGRAGRAREALAQYEDCRRLLREELRARPSQGVEDARRSIGGAPVEIEPPALETIAPPIPTRAAPAGEGGLAERSLPFVGREAELAIASIALDAAAVARGGVLLLALGEPGIGKTRLLTEVSALARRRGCQVLYGRGFEAEMVRPYGAWIDALRSIEVGALSPDLAGQLAPDLAALLPELVPSALMGGAPAGGASTGSAPAGGAPVGTRSPGDIAAPTPATTIAAAAASASGERARLYDAVVRLLLTLGTEGRPVVVVIDDLQWLDDASIALLHYVERELAGRRALLLAAARPAELERNVSADRMLRAVERDGRLHRLGLAALGADATTALVHAVGTELDAAKLHAESAGNPLYALELARSALRGEPGDGSAATLAGLLDERLERLGPEARDLLLWAAALGRSFGADTLHAVCDRPTGDQLRALDELERHGVLRAASHGGYDFAHDLLRRAAYRKLSPPRRRLMHARIAATLDGLFPASGGDGTLAGDVAHHAALGGRSELAVRASIAAGDRCLRLGAPAEAAELAERGLGYAAALPRPTALPLQMELLKIYVHSHLGRHRSSDLEGELARLVEEARAAGFAAAAQTGTYLLATLAENRGATAEARDIILRDTESNRGADAVTAARALGNTGRCLAQIERDQPRAETLLCEAAALARSAGVAVIDIPWGFGLLRHFAGDYDEASRQLAEAERIARLEEDHWSQSQCLTHLAMIEIERGRPAAALAHAEALRGVADKLGEGSEGPVADALAALARRMLDAEGAGEGLARALEQLRAIDVNRFLAYTLNLAGRHDLERGELAEAARCSEEALAAAAASGRGHSPTVIAESTLARAAALAGDRDGAARHLAAAEAEAARPELLLSGFAADALARARAALGVSTPAPTLPSTVARETAIRSDTDEPSDDPPLGGNAWPT